MIQNIFTIVEYWRYNFLVWFHFWIYFHSNEDGSKQIEACSIESYFIRSEQNRKSVDCFDGIARSVKRTMEICLAMNPIVSKMKESLWKAISYLVANDERSILIWCWFPLITLKWECFDSKSTKKEKKISDAVALPTVYSINLFDSFVEPILNWLPLVICKSTNGKITELSTKILEMVFQPLCLCSQALQ